MSLDIDVEKVTGVLLADGWHNVTSKSFILDAYEYSHAFHGGGQSGVCATGASWKEAGGSVVLYCPLTAILAVKTKGESAKKKK